jgi:hypothetical protein
VGLGADSDCLAINKVLNSVVLGSVRNTYRNDDQSRQYYYVYHVITSPIFTYILDSCET